MPPRNASFNLFERDGRYYASIRDPNRHPSRIQRTLRTTDKRVARKKLVDWERAYADGEYDPWTEERRRAVTVKDAIEAYRAHRKDQGDASASIRTRGSRLKKFRKFVGDDVPIGGVRAQTIQDFLDSIPGRFNDEPSLATLASYYNILAGLFSWCIDEGYIQEKDNPMSSIDRPRAPDDGFTILSVEEMEEIRKAILADTRPSPEGARKNRKRFRRYLLGVADFAVASMARVSEIASLRWCQVRLRKEECTAYVKIESYSADQVDDRDEGFTVKTRSSPRTIFVPPRGAYPLLRLWRTYHARHGEPPPPRRIVFRTAWNHPLNPETVSSLWAKYVRKAKIGRRVKFHDLRHTGISWALNDLDVPLAQVQEMAGHGTADRTLSYQISSERSMRDAYLRVSGRTPKGETASHEEVRDFLWREGDYAPKEDELRSDLLAGARA